MVETRSPFEKSMRGISSSKPILFSLQKMTAKKNFAFRSGGFPAGLVLVVIFKLWLVHTEDIYGSATEYDALWYVNAAKHWYWGSPYSWTAFVRPPSYPLFIALVHLCGVPLRMAIELLQMGSYLVMVGALRKAAVSRIVCLVIFEDLYMVV